MSRRFLDECFLPGGATQYSDLGVHHEKILTEMETEAFKIKLDEFDQEMEAQHPMFKFANDYMKSVACIRMFRRATREGNWKPHLESLESLGK